MQNWFLVALLIPSLLPAQSDLPVRERLAGRIRGGDGKPWANATVTVFSGPSRQFPEIGRTDRIVVATDKNGRFRAEVLTRRSYSVWASKDGKLTSVVRASARQTISLDEQDEQPLRLTLEVYGLQSWAEHGKPRVVVVDMPGRSHEIRLDRDGKAVLPELPGEFASLEVWLGTTTRIYNRILYLTKSRREAQRARMRGRDLTGRPARGLPDLRKQPMPAINVHRLLVPPPLVVPVRVVDKTSDAPLAGARVVFASHSSDVFRPNATTAADGTTKIVVPRPIDDWGRPRAAPRLLFHVLADGFRACEAGWGSSARMGNELLNAGKIVDGRTPVLPFELTRGVQFAGRITSKDSPGVVPIQCDIPAIVRARGGLGSLSRGFSTRILVRTNADGSFQVPGITADVAGLALSLVLPDPLLERVLGERPPLPTNRAVRLPVEMPIKPGNHEFDLDNVRVVDVALRRPDGHPAARAQARLLGSTTNSKSIDFYSSAIPSMQADHVGRIRILSFEPQCLLAVLDRDHYLLETIELTPTRLDAPLVETLKPYATVRGRVVDGNGNPVVGANVEIGSQSIRAVDDLVRVIGYLNAQTMRAKTDEQGRFELRFIPNRNRSYKIRARTRIGNRNVYGKDMAPIGQESVDDVTLVFPKAGK